MKKIVRKWIIIPHIENNSCRYSNEGGGFMVVVLFLIISFFITLLFFVNKIRISHVNPASLFNWIKWYALFLLIYYVLSSNQYYIEGINHSFIDIINLSILILISFGMVIYVQQYCIEKEREQKLKEMAVAYALMENELRQKDAESINK